MSLLPTAKYSTGLGYIIHRKNPSARVKINLQGIAIACPFLDPLSEMNFAQHFFEIGLIDENTKKDAFHKENEIMRLIRTKQWSNATTVRVIDLRSDTVSKPTPLMRQAMFEAELGDDVYGDDPTVNELEAKAAQILGKESGLFVASGTMGNLIALMVHANHRGSEVICGNLSHIFLNEQGGPAQLGGIQLNPMVTRVDGTFDLDLMEASVRGDDIHEPVTSLICIENTHNVCGGRVLPQEWVDELGERAKKLNIPIHMDGARIFNAAVHLELSPARLVRDCASVTFCISKGLASPVGALLVGDKEFINRARRTRKVLGGGMRQAGVLAAAGIVSLDHMIEGLKEDHRRALNVATAVNMLHSKTIFIDPKDVQSNIVNIGVNTAVVSKQDLCKRMAMVTEQEADELGEDVCYARIRPVKTSDCVKLYTYYEITDNDISLLIKKFKFVAKEYEKLL